MLAEGRHPTRFELDEVSDETPILLQHLSGHMLAVDSKGLELAGISAETARRQLRAGLGVYAAAGFTTFSMRGSTISMTSSFLP